MDARSGDNGSGHAQRNKREAGEPLRLPIATVLVFGLGGLVLATVLTVWIVGFVVAARNTMELMVENTDLAIESVVQRIRDQLDPAQSYADFFAEQVAKGTVDPRDRIQLMDVMSGALGAMPQVLASVFMDVDGDEISAAQSDGDLITEISSWQDDPLASKAIRDAFQSDAPGWAELVRAKEIDATIMNHRMPIRRDDTLLGLLVSAVRITDLSAYLFDLDFGIPMNVFILLGRDHVLAHPTLSEGFPGLDRDHPLPTLAEFGDPILLGIWADSDSGLHEEEVVGETRIRVVEMFNMEYAFAYREMAGYGSEPLIVGLYVPVDAVNQPVERLKKAALAGLGVLIVAVLVALLVARAISRPIRRLARTAQAIGRLELADAEELGRSHFREIDDASAAFNKMINGLRWFETYVPRRLVARLLRLGADGATASSNRPVTVMFTDIVGFTSMAERLSPGQIADLLNEHFDVLGRCINAEDGTVDKFIGDSVMAFWGAPDDQPDHAERACRAALQIVTAMDEENGRRATRDQVPIRIRVGIHTGPALVGNIGSPDRMNFTLVGDTVNTAQRLEQLGKEMGEPEETTTILISGATAAALNTEFRSQAVGTRQVKGRYQQIDVFKLS